MGYVDEGGMWNGVFTVNEGVVCPFNFGTNTGSPIHLFKRYPNIVFEGGTLMLCKKDYYAYSRISLVKKPLLSRITSASLGKTFAFLSEMRN